jgi:acetyl esterase/lipase
MSIERLFLAGVMLCLQLIVSAAAEPPLSEAAKSAVLMGNHYDVVSNITYGVADNYELKLDVYRPTTTKAPTPVVMLIHGGGWIRHDKEGETLSLLP